MTAAAQSTPTSPATASRWRNRLSGLRSQETVLALVIIVLSVVVGLINPRFLGAETVSDIVSNSSFLAVAAVGMAMVIISGNIDISIGGLIAVLATAGGIIARDTGKGLLPEWFAILAYVVPIVGGVALGAVYGFLVGYLRIPAIIVSLGMYNVLRGGLVIITGGNVIYDIPAWYTLAQQSWLGIPIPVYFMVGATVIAALWMRYTPAGRAIYAVGGNKDAARLSGISERAVLMRVFIINGFMVGLASILVATQYNAIQLTQLNGVELLVITSAVVGGVSILGGTGTIIGSTLGAILVTIIPWAMLFANISAYWRDAVRGLLILITVLVDLLRRRRQTYGRRF